MKTYFTIIWILFFAYSNLFSQLKKGDYLADITSRNSYSNNDAYTRVINVEIEYLKLITSRIMIGGNIGISQTFKPPASSFRIEPEIRYYIGTNKFAPYISLKNRYRVAKFDESVLNEDYNNFQISPGVGFNYSINKFISLETNLDFISFRIGEFKENVPALRFKSGIRIQLNNSIDSKFELRPENIFKKGIISPGISLSNSTHQYRGQKRQIYNLAPSASYFIIDRLSIFGSVSYRYDSVFESNSYGLAIGAAYYAKLNSNIYAKFDIKGYLRYQNTQAITRLIHLPFNVELMYFYNRSRLYFGGTFTNSLSKFLPEDPLIDFPTIHDSEMTAYFGLDYFITSNVFLKGRISLKRASRLDDFTLYMGNLSVGFGMILNQNIEDKSKRRKKG